MIEINECGEVRRDPVYDSEVHRLVDNLYTVASVLRIAPDSVSAAASEDCEGVLRGVALGGTRVEIKITYRRPDNE